MFGICDIVVDAGLLLLLVKLLGDDEIDVVNALVLALVAAIGALLLGWGLGPSLGMLGFLLAKFAAGIGIGVALFFRYGVEVKRALLIGVLYVAVGFLGRLALVAALAGLSQR